MYEYMSIAIGVLISSVVLDILVLKTKTVPRWKPLLFTYVIGAILLILWDTFAITRGHWWYSKQYLVGLKIGLVPVESFILLADFVLVAVIAWEFQKQKSRAKQHL